MGIEIENLKKWYRKGMRNSRPAVEGLTLQVKTGEVFGFLGPNGAGKSTVIKILLNFIRPSAGTAFIGGRPVNDPSARHGIGYLPENPCFYDHLTAEELLKFGGKAAHMNREDIDRRSNELLVRLKLSHVKKKRLRTYSKGMVQRTGLALALIHNPKICILDEPMSGLDPLGRHLVVEMIQEMRNNGQTVFFSSHILSDIERLCDRIGILNRGRMIYCGAMQDILPTDGGLEKAFVDLIKTDEGNDNGADLAAG